VPRRGVRVVPLSPDDMRQIYQILTVLEPEAAASVAKSGLGNDQKRQLESATTEMVKALAKLDLDAWAEADDRFHRTLLGYCGNKRLIAYVNTLFDQAHRARMVTLRLREIPRKSTSEHRAILNAILSGNAVKTRDLFRAHRERAADELMRILENTRLSHL
jgi:DNA-binding GntR family transcriptional regulator